MAKLINLDSETERQIREKVKNLMGAYSGRNLSADSNIDSFAEAVLGMVRKAVNRELNVKKQKEKNERA